MLKGWTLRFSANIGMLVALAALSACGNKESRTTKALSFGDLRWDAFPVALQVDNDHLLDGKEAEEDLLTAVAFWENRAGKTLFTLSAWPSGQRPYRGDHLEDITGNVIYFQAPWPQGWEKRVAGKTILNPQGGSIKNAVIFLNSETTLCSGFCQRERDHTSRRKLIAHELGHFLGFGHVDDANNIMFPEIRAGGELDGLEVDQALLNKLTHPF